MNAEYERHAFNRDAAYRRKSSGENDERSARHARCSLRREQQDQQQSNLLLNCKWRIRCLRKEHCRRGEIQACTVEIERISRWNDKTNRRLRALRSFEEVPLPTTLSPT